MEMWLYPMQHYEALKNALEAITNISEGIDNDLSGDLLVFTLMMPFIFWERYLEKLRMMNCWVIFLVWNFMYQEVSIVSWRFQLPSVKTFSTLFEVFRGLMF